MVDDNMFYQMFNTQWAFDTKVKKKEMRRKEKGEENQGEGEAEEGKGMLATSGITEAVCLAMQHWKIPKYVMVKNS